MCIESVCRHGMVCASRVCIESVCLHGMVCASRVCIESVCLHGMVSKTFLVNISIPRHRHVCTFKGLGHHLCTYKGLGHHVRCLGMPIDIVGYICNI